jgi:hypothetical protein
VPEDYNYLCRQSWGFPVLLPNTSALAVSSGGLETDREATVGLDTKRRAFHFAASWPFLQDLLTTGGASLSFAPSR